MQTLTVFLSFIALVTYLKRPQKKFWFLLSALLLFCAVATIVLLPISSPLALALSLIGYAAYLTWSLKFNSTENYFAGDVLLYRQFLGQLPFPTAIHQVVYDAEATAQDYRFLEVNAAFEKLTGLTARNIVGKSVSRFLMVTPQTLGQIGELALNGGEDVVDEYFQMKGKYFKARAFGLQPGQCAVVLEDVSMKKIVMEDMAATLIRVRRQQTASLKIFREAIKPDSTLANLLSMVTEVSAETLGLSRSSLWMSSSAKDEFICRKMNDVNHGGPHEGCVLRADIYPFYLKALSSGRPIDAHDALIDVRTSELTEAWWQPFGTASVLDVPLKLNEQIVGFLRLEHCGERRRWLPDEIHFSSDLACQIESIFDVKH